MALPGDYSLVAIGEPPPGYPLTTTLDRFSEQPQPSTFFARRDDLLRHLAANPSAPFMKAPFHELARMAAGERPHAGVFEAALDFIDARRDCSDFVIHAVLRWLIQFRGHPDLARLEPRARDTVLGFKYWPDEPGHDSLCTWTENHQILYASAAYISGGIYPEDTFRNSGVTGRELRRRHRPRIERWLELRFRTGFSEWLSHVYYDEDIAALASLIELDAAPAEPKERIASQREDGEEPLRRRAAMVLDVLLLDIALNHFRGRFGCTHGRSYDHSKKSARAESTADLQKLLFGMGVYGGADSMAAIGLALTPRYRLPAAIEQIGRDCSRDEMLNRQRMGLKVEEASRWGIGFEDVEDGMVWLSLEAYNHPRTIELVLRMFDRFGWWHNLFFEPFARYRRWLSFGRRLRLLPWVARLYERDLTRNTREQVDIYTYRTPDYLLSSALDYRPGYGGDQQHIWQATLGPDAVCFTTHPARREGPSPNYWTGSGSLPRVMQVKNVLLAIYRIDTRRGLYLTHELCFTHAWLPRDQFDEVREAGGWIFARRRDGYLALRSRQPYRWQETEGEDRGREVIADGRDNIWICELGRRAVDGSFDRFTERIAAARIEWGELSVDYDSPSQGQLQWGWTGGLKQAGNLARHGDHPRYDNPYVQADFPSDRIEINAGPHHHRLDWESPPA